MEELSAPPSRKRAAVVVDEDEQPSMSGGSEVSAASKLRATEDPETASILRIISLHADHRGPREHSSGKVGPQDNLTRRYMRGRSSKESAGNQYNNANLDVGTSYICHICGESGHHIRLCPRKQGKRQTKKIRTATGIPRSWLRLITPDKIGDYEDIYCLSNGQLAVLNSSAGGSEGGSGAEGGGEVNDTRCPICKKKFRDPQLASCCGTTFCRNCILPWLNSSSAASCYSCHTPRGELDLTPNTFVIDAVAGEEAASELPFLVDLPPPPAAATTTTVDESSSQHHERGGSAMKEGVAAAGVGATTQISGYLPPFMTSKLSVVKEEKG